LKAPTLRESVGRLAERARAESSTTPNGRARSRRRMRSTGRLPATCGRRPRRPLRRRPDQIGAVPARKGGLGLRPRSQPGPRPRGRVPCGQHRRTMTTKGQIQSPPERREAIDRRCYLSTKPLSAISAFHVKRSPAGPPLHWLQT
jgi:hypothetical protein